MRGVEFLLVGLLTAVASAGPVAFEPAELDFGRRGQGLHLEADVKMTNTTGSEIHVLHVTSDCSCAAGEPRQQHLKPGESTVIPVGMDTRSYLGPVVRRLVVHTSAGEGELVVKAKILEFENWEVSPSPVIVPTSVRQQQATAEVAIKYVGSDKVALLSAATDQPWLLAEMPAAPTGGGGRVVLRKLGSAPAGPNTALLTVKTSDPTQPQLAIKVFVPVMSAARVSPNPIILPTTKAGTASTREVIVSGWEEGTTPFARLPLGRVESRGRQPNGDFVFNVSVTPAAAGMSTQTLQFALEEGTVLLAVPVIVKADPR